MHPNDSERPANDAFATTQWSVVLAAGGKREVGAQAALAQLFQSYWEPVYGFIRRREASVEAAQDLTQEFFLRLLERDAIAAASPDRGRFRAFLLTSVKNFLTNERERRRAQKRGSGRVLSLDWETAESRMSWEPADDATPERLFEQAWATTLLARVLIRLQDEHAAAGKQRQFEALKQALVGDRDGLPYADLAEALHCSPDAARQTVHRLRRRYRELLREEVAQTVSDPRQVDEEIRDLFAAFGP